MTTHSSSRVDKHLLLVLPLTEHSRPCKTLKTRTTTKEVTDGIQFVRGWVNDVTRTRSKKLYDASEKVEDMERVHQREFKVKKKKGKTWIV